MMARGEEGNDDGIKFYLSKQIALQGERQRGEK
jgi:hypothetical protein